MAWFYSFVVVAVVDVVVVVVVVVELHTIQFNCHPILCIINFEEEEEDLFRFRFDHFHSNFSGRKWFEYIESNNLIFIDCIGDIED